MSNILPTIRPLPYFSTAPIPGERQLAAALRMEFVPKVTRRLPGHHLAGWKHGFVPAFVRKHKKRYPFFLRTDIAGFYPNVGHADMVVGAQIAYRELLGLTYVPSSFKKRYVGALHRWCDNLPLTNGIPLGSPVSTIAAPVMLLPLWLELKRTFGVPFLVYMDDVLVLTDSPSQSAEIYAFIENGLASIGLSPNSAKTVSGRFSATALEYCGWRFAGGYAGISAAKAEAFKVRLRDEIARCKGNDIRTFVKRVNRKVDGFAHYYKYGDVVRQFCELDVFIRSAVRGWMCRNIGKGRYDNKELESLGFRNLMGIYKRCSGLVEVSYVRECATVPARRERHDYTADVRHLDLIEKMQSQITQMLSLQRKQVRLIQSIVLNW